MEQKEKDALKLKLLRLSNELFDETFQKCDEIIFNDSIDYNIEELTKTKYIIDGILMAIKCIDED